MTAYLILPAGLGLAALIATQPTKGWDSLWKWVAAGFVALFSVLFWAEMP